MMSILQFLCRRTSYSSKLSYLCYFSQQGLSLPQKLTSSGLLFAATSPSAPSFEEYFPGLEDLLARVDFTKLPFKKTLSYEGRFNWKTMYVRCLYP